MVGVCCNRGGGSPIHFRRRRVLVGTYLRVEYRSCNWRFWRWPYAPMAHTVSYMGADNDMVRTQGIAPRLTPNLSLNRTPRRRRLRAVRSAPVSLVR
jgi:hypothetical protein